MASKWLQFGAKAFCVFTEIWTDFVPESAKPGKRTLSLLLTVEKQSSWANLAWRLLAFAVDNRQPLSESTEYYKVAKIMKFFSTICGSIA